MESIGKQTRPGGGRGAQGRALGPQRLGRAAAAGGAALAAAALIAACGGSGSASGSSGSASGGGGKHLDVARVELSIEQSIFREKHMTARVTCPSDVEQRAGNTFTCYATGTVVGKNGRRESFRTPFIVEQQNNSGYVYYHS
ncbi:MAG TPA: hypothetical protein VKU89_08595 [Solirubrobacteraceae bacterium]|nr:hypothetical protein [Solirubrobacteraceae bacterium]